MADSKTKYVARTRVRFGTKPNGEPLIFKPGEAIEGVKESRLEAQRGRGVETVDDAKKREAAAKQREADAKKANTASK